MKIKIRHHDGSMPQEDGWSQMGDWLAELGDDSHTEPTGDAHAEAGRRHSPESHSVNVTHSTSPRIRQCR